MEYLPADFMLCDAPAYVEFLSVFDEREVFVNLPDPIPCISFNQPARTVQGGHTIDNDLVHY
jgi:hypothetical protein